MLITCIINIFLENQQIVSMHVKWLLKVVDFQLQTHILVLGATCSCMWKLATSLAPAFLNAAYD